MKYPNQVQSAVLLDGPIDNLEEIVRNFARVMEAKDGLRFNVPEANPGLFYRLFGGSDLMITFQFLPHPADPAVFQAALNSFVTGMLCSDIRERITRSQAHVLINVSHGVLGTVASDLRMAAMLQEIGMEREGASLPQFIQRLEVAALATRIVADHSPARAVHWVQSDQLLPVELLENYAAASVPGPLHVHPFLYGEQNGPKGQALLGIRTFGMRHFIGGEVRIEPNELPWSANYQTICAFLNVATHQNGYIIPDGDTFGPEDRSLSYRVLHHEAEEGDVPIFELVPLMYREFGFVADDYIADDKVIDDHSPPPELMPQEQEAKQVLVNEWREKRAMAEGVGGRFEVRSNEVPSGSPAPPRPPVTGLRRPVFGRKRAG